MHILWREQLDMFKEDWFSSNREWEMWQASSLGPEKMACDLVDCIKSTGHLPEHAGKTTGGNV